MRWKWLVLLGLPTAALAQPADYSPFEGVGIRTLSIEAKGKARSIRAAISNSTGNPLHADFACTLFSGVNSPIGDTEGYARAVPPGQEIVATSQMVYFDVSTAVCRVTDIRPVSD